MLTNRNREIAAMLAAGVLVALLPLMLGDFYLYVIRLIIIYAISALGLNIFMGFTGQINLGSAAFFCIGAYLPTMLQIKFGWPYLVTFPLAVIASLVIAWVMAFPLLRLKGHAMAIGTLSFALAVNLVCIGFPSLTGGADGIVVPAVTIFGMEMGGIFNYYLILVFGILSYLMCVFLIDSRIGRAFRAIREEEGAASALGVNVSHYKMLAWVVNGALAGLAGCLYAGQSGFLSPSVFSIWTNVVVLVMIVVGGLGTNLGSVVGSAIMTSLPYFLAAIQQYVLLTQGLFLFLFLRFLPEGVVGWATKSIKSIFSRGKLTADALELE